MDQLLKHETALGVKILALQGSYLMIYLRSNIWLYAKITRLSVHSFTKEVPLSFPPQVHTLPDIAVRHLYRQTDI